VLPARGETADEPTVAEPGEGLRVDGVGVTFAGLLALDGVTLGVDPGEVVGVIGPNGAGKTTLFNVICGFVRPDRGTISWRGDSLAGVRPHNLVRLGIARTVQGVRLFPRMTALENVMVGGEHLHRAGLGYALLGLPRADRIDRELREAALDALERFGARDAAGERADSLPYGVQKRVALARALVAKPELLLLDEPAGGLGADDLAELGAAIRELKGAMSVLLVEHRMDLVMSVCDQVAVLDSGRLIASGTPDEVRADPAVLEAYLGAEDGQEEGAEDGA
jgi:branched-chain amino acid transport system ATP-binding protein